jgi:protoheme ferro-lyase
VALQARLGEGVTVRWGMRYGQPAIAGEIEALKSQGCDRILICPLYPQYSGATTASVMDAVGRRWPRCAGSPQSAPCRPITTIRPISRR